ncbi:MAG: phenylalanine--tRNA ligase subunit beta [Armatimonadetes bacterium CG2_30_59_28]|nr:phenylalanine--tRNA ligase subunit beta [Armatimonadota bacterium]OIO89820.1 MAG: phenylalanine--tRNA ligase subunit beta [Armatimonadetes bacterium CG2_30_59_28]PIU65432.1 MAG: phenylalanine--tRNA ligase subunit beta [Armatimonadetes bacterium CG07_land_8_20_14_0_80_59_28]PIX44361.1 MAG: phenylalanine--tRNA ligase subunit beta [Armatimonadetes bacterium CG_4_8_14_3_um_filter_58_9]
MRVPLSWLREFVQIDMPVEELAHLLNMGGLGVEDIRREDDEVALVLEVTSNRGDCLSIVGVAREVAALTGQSMLHPAAAPSSEGNGSDVSGRASVEICEPDLCPRYVARIVEDVRVAASPGWMQKRLVSGGIRPINNIVDATNYVLLEMGQPLHAFDFAALTDAAIVVRRAAAGESVITIDGLDRPLTDEMLVIADAERPVAIAGVMGGLETEVMEGTNTVLIEAAHFNPISVRRTRTALGMSTEASYRFERWIDPAGCLRAADRAVELMAKTAGGTILRGAIDKYPIKTAPTKVALRPAQVKRHLGIEVAPDDVQKMLRRLEFTVTVEDDIVCEVPTFRNDITREADLIEEIARLYGYDNIPVTLPSGVSPQAGEDDIKRLERRAKSVLMRCGLQEVWTFSLTRPEMIAKANMADGMEPLRLRNPLTEDYTVLRTSMLPSILEALSNNVRVGNHDVHVFESGKVYVPIANAQLPDEKRAFAIAMMGTNRSCAWGTAKDASGADFFVMKGVMDHLLRDFGVVAETISWQPLTDGGVFHPGRAATVVVADVQIAALGEVHPHVADEFGLPEKAYLAELDFDALARLARPERRYASLPRFPASNRDIAMIISQDVPAASVEKTIRARGGDLVVGVVLFDVYTGKGIDDDKRSLAFSIRFRSPERTLTDDEVDASLAGIKAALRKELGAILREG